MPRTKHHICERKNLKKIICRGVRNCNFTKEKLLENACQRLGRLKVHQKAFGSLAPPGPAGGA